MKYKNRTLKTGYVDYSPLSLATYSNLDGIGTYRVHVLPIGWFKATLDKVQLETRISARFLWKGSQVFLT
jgi:hypothetical protein